LRITFITTPCDENLAGLITTNATDGDIIFAIICFTLNCPDNMSVKK